MSPLGIKCIMDTELLIHDFYTVAKFAGYTVPIDQITVAYQSRPHKQPKLPFGKIACYAFLFHELCLKVGKIGSNSQPRFGSQHYLKTGNGSTLAKSLLKHRDLLISATAKEFHSAISQLNSESVGDWIRTHCCRYAFFLPGKYCPLLLGLLEAFLHCRLKPIFEGKVGKSCKLECRLFNLNAHSFDGPTADPSAYSCGKDSIPSLR